jgi:hypothetical protein
MSKIRGEMKVVGHRKPPKGGLEATDGLLKLGRLLRGDKPFIPKGLHRYKTFEESELWAIKWMAGTAENTQEHQN